MTNQASELYELCKEVYGRTGWDGEGVWGTLPQDFGKDAQARLYTSDYLLEKLPSPLIFNGNDCAIEVRRTKKDKYMWSANIRHSYGQYFKQIADTPLKALLKLTVALSEAGELK